MHLALLTNRLVFQPLGAGQNNTRTCRQSLRGLAPGCQRYRFSPLRIRYIQCFQPASRHASSPASTTFERRKPNQIASSELQNLDPIKG